MRLSLMPRMGVVPTVHVVAPFVCLFAWFASTTDCSTLKIGNIIFFPAGTVHERVAGPPVVPARNHICPEGSAGQLSNVVNEKAYCHHFTLQSPYFSPPSVAFGARTPGFVPSANTIVDPRSATRVPTTNRPLHQCFMLSFKLFTSLY